MTEDDMNVDFDMDYDSDDVANLVHYVHPPNGTHIYGIRFCGMDECWPGGPRGVRLVYQKLATVEKVEAEDLDAPNGSLMTESFSGNEMSKKILKARLSQIFGESFKGGSFRPYIESLNEKKMSDFHLQLTTKIKVSNGKGEKKDQTFENVRITSCVPVACVELPKDFEPYDYEPVESVEPEG